MIRSAVTISLVPEAQGGPFVFWGDLPAAITTAARLGFDALEVFAPGPDAIPPETLGRMLHDAGLRLAAVGTGAGWVKHKLTLTDADPVKRKAAKDFIREMIEWGAAAGLEAAGEPAPAIIGSMQGRWGGNIARDAALGYLTEALNDLGELATRSGGRGWTAGSPSGVAGAGPKGSPGSLNASGKPEGRPGETPASLLIEPLNRYETNLLNTLADGSRLLRSLTSNNIRLLADLFHMNIEEVDSATALSAAGDDVGHIHFVDSNRRPAGSGHIDYAPLAAALAKMKYSGYVSAEALPWPSPVAAAEQTIKTFRRAFRMPGS